MFVSLIAGHPLDTSYACPSPTNQLTSHLHPCFFPSDEPSLHPLVKAPIRCSSPKATAPLLGASSVRDPMAKISNTEPLVETNASLGDQKPE